MTSALTVSLTAALCGQMWNMEKVVNRGEDCNKSCISALFLVVAHFYSCHNSIYISFEKENSSMNPSLK